MYPSFQYFCSICVLFDEEKGQYHCKGCGLCRLGGEDKFFHCDKCEMCLPVSLQPSHKVCITYCSINDISFKTIQERNLDRVPFVHHFIKKSQIILHTLKFSDKIEDKINF